MTGEQNNDRPRPTRAQRIVAFAFLGAFGLTIVTVLFTGLMSRSAKNRHEESPPIIEQPARPAEPVRAPPPTAPSESTATPAHGAPRESTSAPAHDDASRDARSETVPDAPEARGTENQPSRNPER